MRAGCVLTLCAVTVVVLVSVTDSTAYAADPTVLAVDDLNQVVDRLRAWLIGILAGIATLFLTLGAVRLLAANGDPTEAEKGKTALKSAALGYALAILAPVLVTIVGSWVN